MSEQPQGFYRKRNALGQLTTRPVVAPTVVPFHEPDLEIFRQTVRDYQGKQTFTEGEVLNEIGEYNDEYGDPEHGPAPASLADVAFELGAPSDVQEAVEESLIRINPEIKRMLDRLIQKGLVSRVVGGYLITEEGRQLVATRPVLSRRGQELLVQIQNDKSLAITQFDPSDFVLVDALEARHFIKIDRKAEHPTVKITPKGVKELSKAQAVTLPKGGALA